MNYNYIIKELRHHHHRTAVNVLGIAIGIALFIAINAVSTAYKEALSQPFRNIGADIVIQRAEKRTANDIQSVSMQGIRLPFSNQPLSPEDREKLRTITGVDSVAASLLLWEFGEGGFKTIMGFDPADPSLGPVKVKDWIKEGRFPQHTGEVVFEKHFAKFSRAKLGDTVQIGNRSFNLVGLLEIREGSQIASANIYMSLPDAQSLLKDGLNTTNIFYVRLKDPSLINKVKDEAVKRVQGISAASSDSFLELMGGVSKISDQFSFLASLVAFAGAVFLIIKTMLSNLVERSREIGILKAIGWTGKNVQEQLMGEVFIQSVLGGVIGIIAGYVISFLLGMFPITVSMPWELNLVPAFAKESALAAQSVRLPVRLSVGLIFSALVLSFISGGLASFFMGRRTAKMKPAEILRRL
jgi:putative ABC transport system permease protein